MGERQTVVFDFDGVIHSYKSGWQGDTIIPDPPVIGIKSALRDIHDTGYEIVIVSTRCATEEGTAAVKAWLEKYRLSAYIDRVCVEKVPAIVYVDDRAIRFDGDPGRLLGQINRFMPWHKKQTIRYENGASESYDWGENPFCSITKYDLTPF